MPIDIHGVYIMTIRKQTKPTAKPTGVKPNPVVAVVLHDQWFDAAPDTAMPDYDNVPKLRFVGRYSRKRIVDFQNLSFDDYRADMLCDREIAAAWTREHPRALAWNQPDKMFPTGHVGGARNSYNAGNHGNTNDKWRTPCPKFVDPLKNGGQRGVDSAAAKRAANAAAKRAAAVK